MVGGVDVWRLVCMLKWKHSWKGCHKLILIVILLPIHLMLQLKLPCPFFGGDMLINSKKYASVWRSKAHPIRNVSK